VRQREVDGFDAVLVLFAVDCIVDAANGVGRLDFQFLLERRDEGLEQVHVHALGRADHARQLIFDQGRKHDRTLAVACEAVVDAARRFVRFFA
jgi:hypothetical protein